MEDFSACAPPALKARLAERGSPCKAFDPGTQNRECVHRQCMHDARSSEQAEVQGNDPVSRAARTLKLKPGQDDGLMWVAEHAAVAKLPADWEEMLDNEGRVAYYHPA